MVQLLLLPLAERIPLINVDRQVDCIWCGRQPWLKFVYALIRHLPYLAQLTVAVFYFMNKEQRGHLCYDLVALQACINAFLTIMVESVLVMRAYALFNRSPIFIKTIVLLFIMEVAAIIIVICLGIRKLDYNQSCLVTSLPPMLALYWLLPLAFETLLFALTLIKMFITMRSYLGRHLVFSVVLRDAICAFGVVFAIRLLNTLFYELVKSPLAGLFFFWEISIMSSTGSHMLLNIRSLAAHADSSSDEDYGLNLSTEEPDTVELTTNVAICSEQAGSLNV
ncbi:uncharacterized protein LAESUDRAFT_721677 [Laetiporus sulphureus 93-53]|uniref:Uncharacterized protein n=1 Tax=Laetiporus sulphureus 93-53 TaxID=1314785 RepID=A0A165GH66_9APHY|nr:uncharacterized protein LAESUDRAFT_721677 [Laetiporus sulphureus 93-53]KZT10342.1 hypothetical protein LAESUDRAFT_721677 [Laetiporus sulphureus 93-53]